MARPLPACIRRGDAARNEGVDVCVTVTLVDGLVLARSAFHHSMNFRSVMVIGKAVEVTDPAEKAAALHRFVEALVPGRQADLRPNTQKEIKGTSVLRLSLEHASAKIRAGGPIDDDEDYALPIWAGVVPMRTVFDPPVSDASRSSMACRFQTRCERLPIRCVAESPSDQPPRS